MGLLDQLMPAWMLRPEQLRDLAKKTQRMAVEEGRIARRMGLPRDHITGRFVDNNMTIDWHNGWRWEDEEIRERERVRKPKGRRRG